MILVSGIKLPFDSHEGEAVAAALKALGIGRKLLAKGEIYKRSLDLRKKSISRVYSVLIETYIDENKLVSRLNNPQIKVIKGAERPVCSGESFIEKPPVIAGFGPGGMFAALVLAENGFKPIVLERGAPMGERDEKTKSFFESGLLDADTNVQFGEGGAGTYSDGKLTTRIHDSRARLVAEYLVANGAPQEILCDAKPHIGTDLLKNVVVSIREKILALGGTVLFNTKLTGIKGVDGKIKAVATSNGEIETQALILATGHSGRDIYSMLFQEGISIENKNFAVGARIEHPRELIDASLYGEFYGKYALPPGEYALAKTENGRGCYTFCMCPGGHVWACASEGGGVVTNGMSYHARDGENSNSALVVTVGRGDFGPHPLAGVNFQIDLEKKAFQAGGGQFKAPLQLVGDFLKGERSVAQGSVTPTYNRGVTLCDLGEILPPFVTSEMQDGLRYFGRKIHDFDIADAILTGVETRTSAPVRILRRDDMVSPSLEGLYPCGEGAGFAGGIMSSAVDGVKIAQEIMKKYKPRDN